MSSSEPILYSVPERVVLPSLEGLLECHQVLVAELGGPALVPQKLGPHTYHLQSLGRRMENLLPNGQDLKHYFQEVGRRSCLVHSLLVVCCFHHVLFSYYLCFCFV